MLRFIALMVSALALAGCVSTKNVPLKKETFATYQGRSIAVSTREKPAFSAMTAGKAMFGAIGGAAMIIAGNKIVNDNEVEDPAGIISAKLLESVSAGHELKHVPTAVLAKGTGVAELAGQYSSADILLDVQTVNWTIAYFPTDWNSYRVIYSAKVRLIDTHKSKILAESFCARIPENSETAPSYDDLLATRWRA